MLKTIMLGAATLLGVTAMSMAAAPLSASWDAAPKAQASAQFWRLHWYERGAEHGNPYYAGRFRVNAPEVSVHPVHGKRQEARSNGMMLIKAEEDLLKVKAAELYLEMWGGHPGTANKRVTVNGRSTYALEKVGTEEGHCTYSYPVVGLKVTDLVNGYNALQFAVDQGTTFWGHMIVDNACLRVALAEDHPDLKSLEGFEAKVLAAPGDGETIELSLEAEGTWAQRIASVDFQGYYLGYDENGNRLMRDWHGYTKGRVPQAMLGRATEAPFAASWDTSMLPSQKDVAVRALVRFKDLPEVVYVTAAQGGLEVAERPGARVVLIGSPDQPVAFWSRANRQRQCNIYVDIDPARIERAELHVTTWTGGPGEVKDYFTLNGVHFPVADGSAHQLVYSRLAVDPQLLVQGENRVALRSDTEHHGIEVLLPGPCLMVRYRTQ